MKTKIVFVLTSKEKDIYLEQLWVSLYSLRLLMPKGDAYVVLITDKITENTFIGYRKKFLELIDEKIVVDLDSSMSGLQRSRWLKTKSRDLVKGDMYYIDSDTVFVNRLDDLDDLQCELGAVKDMHVDRVHSSRAWGTPKSEDFVNNCKTLGYDVTKETVTFNGGMVYAKDTPLSRKFFSMWHEEWLRGTRLGVNTDQPSYSKTNIALGHPMQEISGVWNCQVAHGLKYLFNAKVLHYFAVSTYKKSKSFPYWFMNDFVYEDVKKKGEITDDIKKALQNPLEQFCGETKILVDEEVALVSTRTFVYAYYLFTKKPKIFKILESLLKTISKSKKSLT